MRILTLMFAVLLTCAANGNEPTQRPVPLDLGPKSYRDGDVIQITSVTATSPRLEQGDTVTVKGRVRLDSATDARLCLFLTQTQGDGYEETDARQTQSIKAGLSDFELKTTIKHRGVLHVTLYRTTNGKPFGGVYFGTPEQMKAISDWDVSYYLED